MNHLNEDSAQGRDMFFTISCKRLVFEGLGSLFHSVTALIAKKCGYLGEKKSLHNVSGFHLNESVA